VKDEEGKIGIGDWAEAVIENIRRFADQWNAQREAGDPAHPERMGQGDWDERFNFFCAANAALRINEEVTSDDVDRYDGYMDAPPKRECKTKPLSTTYRKFEHLAQVLRAGIGSDEPIHRAAAEMWVAIEKANTSREAR
jgi:hypothetical protein